MSGGGNHVAASALAPVEAVRDIRVHARLALNGLDLVATSVAAFVGGWIIGYLATVS